MSGVDWVSAPGVELVSAPGIEWVSAPGVDKFGPYSLAHLDEPRVPPVAGQRPQAVELAPDDAARLL